MKIYIKGLTELEPDERPDYRRYLAAGEIRRLSDGLRKAVYVSDRALEKAGTDRPQGVVASTDAGCILNTQSFLDDIAAYGESALKPSCFMYSTHNSFASAIALHLKCGGYNVTHSNGERSLLNALQDCVRQIKLGRYDDLLLCHAEEKTALMPDSREKFMACVVSSTPGPEAHTLCLEEFQSYLAY